MKILKSIVFALSNVLFEKSIYIEQVLKMRLIEKMERLLSAIMERQMQLQNSTPS